MPRALTRACRTPLCWTQLAAPPVIVAAPEDRLMGWVAEGDDAVGDPTDEHPAGRAVHRHCVRLADCRQPSDLAGHSRFDVEPDELIAVGERDPEPIPGRVVGHAVWTAGKREAR